MALTINTTMHTPEQIKALVVCSKCRQKQQVTVRQWNGVHGWACLTCGTDLSSEFERNLRLRVRRYGVAARKAAVWVDKYGGDKSDLRAIDRYRVARGDLDKVRDLIIEAGKWRMQNATE